MSYRLILSLILMASSLAQAAVDYSLCAPELAEEITRYVDLTKPNVDILQNPAGVLTAEGQQFGTWGEVETGRGKTSRTLSVFEKVDGRTYDHKLGREITFYMSEFTPGAIAAITVAYKEANKGWTLGLERVTDIQYSFLTPNNKCVLQRVQVTPYEPSRTNALYRSRLEYVSYDMQTCRDLESFASDQGWHYGTGPCWSREEEREEVTLPAICRDRALNRRVTEIVRNDYQGLLEYAKRISPEAYQEHLGGFREVVTLGAAILHGCRNRKQGEHLQAMGNADARFNRVYLPPARTTTSASTRAAN